VRHREEIAAEKKRSKQRGYKAEAGDRYGRGRAQAQAQAPTNAAGGAQEQVMAAGGAAPEASDADIDVGVDAELEDDNDNDNENTEDEKKVPHLMKLFSLSGAAKLPAIIEHLEAFLNNPLAGKVLVFGHHRTVLQVSLYCWHLV